MHSDRAAELCEKKMHDAMDAGDMDAQCKYLRWGLTFKYMHCELNDELVDMLAACGIVETNEVKHG